MQRMVMYVEKSIKKYQEIIKFPKKHSTSNNSQLNAEKVMQDANTEIEMMKILQSQMFQEQIRGILKNNMQNQNGNMIQQRGNLNEFNTQLSVSPSDSQTFQQVSNDNDNNNNNNNNTNSDDDEDFSNWSQFQSNSLNPMNANHNKQQFEDHLCSSKLNSNNKRWFVNK